MRLGNYIGSGQVCWKCKKGSGGCAWSNYLKPIKGWDAELVICDEDLTYRIKECPEFAFEDADCSDCVFSNGKVDRSQYDRCGLCAYHPSHKGIGDSLKETE